MGYPNTNKEIKPGEFSVEQLEKEDSAVKLITKRKT
jgi:hypothetical protein